MMLLCTFNILGKQFNVTEAAGKYDIYLYEMLLCVCVRSFHSNYESRLINPLVPCGHELQE